jgi:hypothetical protein
MNKGKEASKMPEETKPTSKAKKPAAAKPAARAKTAGAGAAGQKAAAARPAGTATAGRAGAKKAEKRLEKVPAEYVFYCYDGGVYRDLAELAAGLAAMSDETFAYHSNRERQDFCNWVRDVIEDIELANDLAAAVNRIQAADCVADHILYLSR